MCLLNNTNIFHVIINNNTMTFTNMIKKFKKFKKFGLIYSQRLILPSEQKRNSLWLTITEDYK